MSDFAVDSAVVSFKGRVVCCLASPPAEDFLEQRRSLSDRDALDEVVVLEEPAVDPSEDAAEDALSGIAGGVDASRTLRRLIRLELEEHLRVEIDAAKRRCVASQISQHTYAARRSIAASSPDIST